MTDKELRHRSTTMAGNTVIMCLAIGKPSIGVHLSVEGNNLDGTDFFDPGEYWVSGAQRYDLDALLSGVGNGDSILDPGEMVSYDVLLSLYSDSTAIPVPPAVWLFGSGLLGLIGMARRRRS